jgi:uncharacterized protein YuzE
MQNSLVPSGDVLYNRTILEGDDGLRGDVMKIVYDREEDILTLEFKDAKHIDHAEHVESIILHLNEADEPILLEVLHASDFLTQVLKASLQPDKLAA